MEVTNVYRWRSSSSISSSYTKMSVGGKVRQLSRSVTHAMHDRLSEISVSDLLIHPVQCSHGGADSCLPPGWLLFNVRFGNEFVISSPQNCIHILFYCIYFTAAVRPISHREYVKRTIDSSWPDLSRTFTVIIANLPSVNSGQSVCSCLQ